MFSPYRFWILMQGLYYPAVLGAALFAIIMRISNAADAFKFPWKADDIALDRIDLPVIFGVLLVLYFSMSFLATQSKEHSYHWILFVLDLFEVVVVFCAFFFLGLFETSPTTPVYQSFYLSLAVLPIIQQLWNWTATAHSSKWLLVLSVVAALTFGYGYGWGYLHEWFNRVMVPALMAMIALYLYIGEPALGESEKGIP